VKEALQSDCLCSCSTFGELLEGSKVASYTIRSGLFQSCRVLFDDTLGDLALVLGQAAKALQALNPLWLFLARDNLLDEFREAEPFDLPGLPPNTMHSPLVEVCHVANKMFFNLLTIKLFSETRLGALVSIFSAFSEAPSRLSALGASNALINNFFELLVIPLCLRFGILKFHDVVLEHL